MADRIIIKNTDLEANLENVQAADVLNGEILLVRETDKERLYCKNSDGEISPIHRFWNAGGFARIEPNVIEVQKADTIAGDVCVWDGNTKRFLRLTDNTTADDLEEYTPIGVVVVPASHTDDGTARIISLASMDYNNPDNGNTNRNVSMCWGGDGYDILTLKKCQYSPRINTDLGIAFGDTQRIIDWINQVYYLSSDYYFSTTYEGPTNPYDTATCYGSSSSYACPSPYLNDGSKNELYSQVYDNGSGIGNMAEQMDGRVNTNVILDIDNNNSTDWQTASTITNTGRTETIHPAAQCCWRYHTVGTNQGDWYLPAAGELGYLASRWDIINTSIQKVISSGFEALVLSVTNNGWLSSTTGGGGSDYVVGFTLYYRHCYLNGFSKYYNFYVRAFLAV